MRTLRIKTEEKQKAKKILETYRKKQRDAKKIKNSIIQVSTVSL